MVEKPIVRKKFQQKVDKNRVFFSTLRGAKTGGKLNILTYNFSGFYSTRVLASCYWGGLRLLGNTSGKVISLPTTIQVFEIFCFTKLKICQFKGFEHKL